MIGAYMGIGLFTFFCIISIIGSRDYWKIILKGQHVKDNFD